MPFAARRRHQFWSADVRYLKGLKLPGRFYVISVLDNHSRTILASAVTRTQDLASYLAVLYAAIERYGSPEVLVTDGGASSGRGRPGPPTRPSGSTKKR
jgi:transposase InsO family protein